MEESQGATGTWAESERKREKREREKREREERERERAREKREKREKREQDWLSGVDHYLWSCAGSVGQSLSVTLGKTETGEGKQSEGEEEENRREEEETLQLVFLVTARMGVNIEEFYTGCCLIHVLES